MKDIALLKNHPIAEEPTLLLAYDPDLGSPLLFCIWPPVSGSSVTVGEVVCRFRVSSFGQFLAAAASMLGVRV
jgi:hypothetical protein